MSQLWILSGQGKNISVVSSDDVLYFDDHVGLGLCALKLGGQCMTVLTCYE
jgi:hypothetical protein